MKLFPIVSLVSVLAATGIGYRHRSDIRDYTYQLNQPDLPAETSLLTTTPGIAVGEPHPSLPQAPSQNLPPAEPASPKDTPATVTPPSDDDKKPETPTVIPSTPPVQQEINLAVPFTSQAPLANWDYPYQEACEEASVIMADAYFKSISLTTATSDAAILKLVDWEIDRFGYYKDTTAAETVIILKEYFGLQNSRLEKIESQEKLLTLIKTELSRGNVLLMPAAGRLLGNPNFRAPGPLFHMITIKGYTKDNLIITNDPGTRRGHNYTYSISTLYSALHDWNDGDVANGEKVMIVVSR